MRKYTKQLNMNLLKVRTVFLAIAFIHLVVTAVVTLSIDTRGDEDPRIRGYFYVRWTLLTCWFNMMTLVYLPIRLFSDIKSQIRLGQDNTKIEQQLNQFTDILMTSIILPITVYGDVIFWIFFLTKPSMIASVRVFSYLPGWSQHSLHTVSLVVVIIDLLLTPRQRPNSMKPRLAILTAFITVYCSVVYGSLSKGVIVYSFMENGDLPTLITPLVVGFTCSVLIFYAQWFLIELVWKRKLSNVENNLRLLNRKLNKAL